MKRRIAVDLSVLRESRNLRLLVIGELFSGLGSQAALVAIPFQIYTLTHSPALVGLLGIVELVPIVIGSLFGGAIADRIERRRLMLAAQTAILVSAAALAAITFAERPAGRLIFVFAALLAGGATVDNVTRSAIVPALAGDRLQSRAEHHLRPAPGRRGRRTGARRPDDRRARHRLRLRRAGRRLRDHDRRHARRSPASIPAPTETEHLPILRSIREGFTFVRGNSALMGSFAIDLVAMTFGMPRALFAVLALDVFDAGASGTGLLYASVSAGAVVAALTTGWVEHARWLGRIVIGAVARLGPGDRRRRASCRRSGPPRRCWRSPARPTASAPSAARSSTSRSRRRRCAAGCRRSSCSW